MTRRLLCTATCLALCWCTGMVANAAPTQLSATAAENTKGYRGPVSPNAVPVPGDQVATQGGAPRGPGLYTTGFEAGEGYAPGTISAQVGWGVSTVGGVPQTHAQISTANPANGAQHLAIQDEAAQANGTLLFAFSPPVTPTPVVGPSVVTLNCFIPTGAQANYRIQAQTPSQGFLTWRVEFDFGGTILVIDDLGGGFVIHDTGVVFPTNQYFELKVEFIPSIGLYTYYIDGTPFYTSVGGVFAGTIVEQVIIGSDSWQDPAETGDFDDLDIANLVVAGGACCDMSTAICTDVADVNDCSGPNVVFSPGLTCAQVACNLASGACCTEGRVCTDNVLVTDCDAMGGTFFGNGSTCASATCPLECQSGGSGQIPDGNGHGAGNTIAVVSDRTRPLAAADNFVPVSSGQITSVRWWGLYVDLGAGTACADGAVPDDFQITYYVSGSDGVTQFPGQVLAGPFTVAASKVNSGFGGFGGFWEYEATHPPVDVEAGFCYWIEITDTSDTVCEWLWIVAGPGDALSAQTNPTTPYEAADVDNDFDLGFCLNIAINADGCTNSLPLPGACCLYQLDACMESDVDTCAAQGGTFVGPFTTCTAGACDGACCTGTNCQQTTLFECDQIFGFFNGVGVSCSDPDPCALQACCDGAGFCSDLSQADCIGGGGAFFPGVTCADGPNCPTGEVFLAPTINCNSNYVTNNAALPPAGEGTSIVDMSCIGGGPGPGFGEFWITFTATDTSAFISTRNSVVDDTVIEVFTDGGATAVPNGCNEDIDGTNFRSEVCIPTDIGTQYWILVASFDAASQGPITVDLVCPCPATCESCPGDTNGDTILDGGDIQEFTRCLIGAEPNPTACVCADMNGDAATNADDITDFVDAILNGGFCPGFPIQTCDVGSNGQTPDLENGRPSNAVETSGVNIDNFSTLTGGTITELSWWGVYLGDNCPDSADSYSVTIYNDDNNGVPGTVVQSLTNQVPTRTATGRNLLGIADEFKYTLSGLNINLAPGCYWLAIGNMDSPGGCVWFWSTSNDGDAIRAFNDGTTFTRIEGTDAAADDNDFAWCMDIAISDNSTCLVPTGACCQSGTCVATTTEDDCVNNFVGLWFSGEDCASFACPAILQGGDECAAPLALSCNGGPVLFTSLGATSNAATDASSSCEIAGGGPFTHDASIWFQFTATNTSATISLCGSDPAEDSVMTLFGPNETCGALTEFACNDDFCTAPAFGPPEISATGLTVGANYLILVDFYSGGHTDGPHTIEITCP